MIVTNVLQQHADDAIAIAESRPEHLHAAYTNLARLEQADQRLLAHLEGLQLAGEHATQFFDVMRGNLSAGAIFLLTVRALERNDTAAVNELIAMVQALPDVYKGMVSAFGWVDRSSLRGMVLKLLADNDPFKRLMAVTACGVHRVDPGLVKARRLQDPSPAVRARAFRAAGEVGFQTLAAECVHASRTDEDPQVRYWASWSAALLGDRMAGADLKEPGFSTGPATKRFFRLALQKMPLSLAHRVLQDIERDAAGTRSLIEGSGIVGDPSYVPWLIGQMADLSRSRLAGEAFTFITGINLGESALDRPAPEDFESGPTDDPDDPNVDMDPDDGLPWPDVGKIEAWWAANSHRFQKGTRSFMGAPVTREHCVHVLKTGYQRQRILAAHYLCLLEPGTPLFNTSAPAWRQQKLLARL